jgi:nitrogen regulatory protein PII-like uncharacterized protein
MTDKTYKVYLTPLIGDMEYGDEIEISDYVTNSNVGSIKKNTDSDDGVIGEYLLGSWNLTCANFNGEFNEGDPRSYFKAKRDNSKIRVVYFDSLTDESASFKGIISEEGTNNTDDDFVKIKVLALESILRKVQVAGGTVEAGQLFSTAIKALLNQTRIKAVLTYDSSEIEVDLDLVIDDEAAFTNVSTWEAIKQLLVASNSVIYIDNETVKVKPRDYKTYETAFFYGPGDTLDRENIIKISNWNNGAHRVFNSVKINETLYTDETSANWFGLSETSFTLGFITDADKELQIATNIVNQFRYPRQEFEMTVPTSLANEVDFFDTIGVSHPIRTKPVSCCNGTMWDVAKYDTPGDFWNVDFGGTSIDARLAFKIIQRTENPKEFTTTLKLRGRGKTFDDGVLIHWASVWDESIYDVSTW